MNALPREGGPLLMRRKRAAEFLGLSSSEFWRLEQRGVIPPGAKLPGQKRGTWWHRDQLVQLAAQLVQP